MRRAIPTTIPSPSPPPTFPPSPARPLSPCTRSPPGTYAIQTFQDVNSNDKMDTNWLGLPLEPFGFSHDAKPFLSKPSFDDVKFTVAAGENSQVSICRIR